MSEEKVSADTKDVEGESSKDNKKPLKSLKKEEAGLDDSEENAENPVKGEESQLNKLVDDAASEDDGEEGGDRNGDYDSSEEDDDDDDEEAIRKVREGFIVSDDEAEEEGEEDGEGEGDKRKDHKRKHAHSGNGTAEELDEDDLELLRENAGESVNRRSKFKRLKRGGDEEDEETSKSKGLTDMFLDEENEEGEGNGDEEDDDLMEATRRRRQQREGMPGEFDDFIEDDEMSEDDDDRDERLARMRSARAKNQFAAESRVDQDKMDELFEIFGDGEEYAWAIEAEKADLAGNGISGAGDAAGEENEDEEDENEGEDESEVEEIDKQEAEPQKQKKSYNEKLKDVFELGELKKHLLTDEDDAIRAADVPERYQLLRKDIDNYDLPDEEFVLKQQWIAEQLFAEKSSSFENSKDVWEPFKDCVFHIVEFVSRDNLEVPVIWSCRKDYTLHTYQEEGQLRVQKLLNENDLWRIVQLDIEYHAILDKRQGIQKLFDSLHVVDILFDRLIKDAKSIPALQDLYEYLSFTYSKEIHEKEEKEADDEQRDHPGSKKHKIHSRFNIFERIKEDPIYKVVEAFGMTAEHFGENVSSNARIYVTEDPAEKPDEVVKKNVSSGSYFKQETKALNAVKHMYSEQLAHSPELRAHLRNAYEHYATIDIRLTEKGRDEIGEKSPYADFKYAENRAMESFVYKPDLFPRMLEAESLGLCHINVGLKSAYKSFVDHLFTFLSSDGTSDISNSWNTLRRSCLDLALGKMLPSIASEIKEELGQKSERLLFFQIRDKFLNKVDQAPFAPVPTSKGSVPRVLALSNGDGKRNAAVLAAAIDGERTVVECVKFEENYRESEFEKKFVGLVTRFKPDVVAISGYTPEVSAFFKHTAEIVKMNHLMITVKAASVKKEEPEDDYDPEAGFEDEQGATTEIPLPVIYSSNETALIYEHSMRAKQEFGDKPRVAKFCIGVARYVQDPLLEYISLGDSITSVSVDKHQELLAEEKFREAVDSIFVDMVCLVGIKLNDAIRSDYEAKKLSYIAGLGVRKAAGVLRGIESQGGAIVRRDDLILKGLVTKTVFMNCAPFVNLPVPDRYDKEVELLDATRIHPEDYELARKMASDALDLTDEDRVEIEQEEGGVVGKLYEDGVEKLDDLLLEGYADQLEQHGHRKRATLEMIKEELQNNFEELRKEFHVLTPEEVFQMLTAETPDTFHENLLVPVIIQRVDNRYLAVITQSGIRGNISRSSILPYNDPSSLLSRFNVGQPVRAVVKSIDHADFRAEMSLLKEDLEQSQRGVKVEKFKGLWNFEAEEQDRAKEQRESLQTQGQHVKRFIKHPFFRNFNSRQAEDYLASQENGAFVIRPSSKGPGHLTVTWKLGNQLFQHIDVIEHDKLNEYTLGRVLQVGQFRYHDLDELIVSHINKMYAKVQTMTSYEKFRNEPSSEARSWLLRYSKANKNRSCYCFCFNRKAPGWFYLLFKLNDESDNTYTWNVKVLPTGFQLHGNVYPDMVHLCNGFKRLLQNQLSGSSYGNSYNPGYEATAGYSY